MLVVNVKTESKAADNLAACAVGGKVPNAAAKQGHPARQSGIDALIAHMQPQPGGQTNGIVKIAGPEG